MFRTLHAIIRNIAVFLCILPALTVADELRIAVASNFRPAMEQLVTEFEAGSVHTVSASYGSTGKHYAQLINGAPFDIFLAADTKRPRQLEASGIGVAGSRFTYALGGLVLWVRNSEIGEIGMSALKHENFRFLAIANPRIAPYGLAAEQFLKRMDLWEDLQSRIVRGENVAQAFAFVSTGNADMGLIALSQSRQVQDQSIGEFWLVPEDSYDPIEQQAITLNERAVSMAFLEFLRGPIAREVIANHGYSVP